MKLIRTLKKTTNQQADLKFQMTEGKTVEDLKVVYVLIQNQERKVLLINNTDGGGWSLPGGKVEKGEALVEALKRGVMEETGFNTKIGDIVSINEGKSTQMNVHALFIMFKAIIKNEVIDIRMGDEISETKWMAIEEADQKFIHYNHSLKVFLGNKATYYNEGVID